MSQLFIVLIHGAMVNAFYVGYPTNGYPVLQRCLDFFVRLIVLCYLSTNMTFNCSPF